MSETSKKNDGLDEVLGAWPDGGKTEAEWDACARDVVRATLSAEGGISTTDASDDEAISKLLSPPLGQTDAERHNSAIPASGRAPSGPASSAPDQLREGKPMTTADRERDRRSLQELARLAQLTPAPASVAPSGSHRASAARSDDDSGLVDLAAASLVDPQAAVRAQSTPLASAGLFDDVVPEAPVSYRPVTQPPPSRGPASFAPASGVPAAPSVPSLVPGALASAPSIAPSQPPVARPSVPGALLSQPALASQPVPTLAPAAAPLAPVSAPRVPALATASYAALVLPKKPSKRLVALGVIGALALAAGGVFAVRAAQNGSNQAVAASSIEAPKRLKDEDIPLPEPTAENVAAQNGATAVATEIDEPAADEGTALDPNALPEAQTTTAAHHGTKAATAASKGAVAQTASKTTTAKSAAATAKNDEAGKLTERDLPPSSGVVGALGDEMRKAVGDKGNDPSPAAGATGPQFAAGTVPQKPSQGAVTSAIGTVLPSARGCLGPDDPISRAAVVFGSAGTVQSVRVSGGAAGKPAEACIQSALGKAKLAPFAEPTYTANITVRP